MHEVEEVEEVEEEAEEEVEEVEEKVGELRYSRKEKRGWEEGKRRKEVRGRRR